MDYLMGFLILVGIYSILSLSLNILIGYTGILSMAQAAIFGTGAYASALIVLKLNLPFLAGLMGAILATGLICAVVAIPSLRVKGDYFIVASFGIQFVLNDAFINLTSLTRGAAGLRNIPHPSIIGLTFDSNLRYLVLTWFCVGAVAFIVWWLKRSPLGRTLQGIREDEVAVAALGKSVHRAKVIATVFSGSLAAIGGSLYAHYIAYIDPFSFTIHDSIFILTCVVVGGMGTIVGSVMGPLFLMGLPEVLRFLAIPDSVAGPGRQILYGALLICFMRFRPNGLFGKSLGSRGDVKAVDGIDSPQIAGNS